MPEINSNKKVKDDEIDLLELFRRIGKTLGNWGSAFVTAFLISVVFLLRRWLPLAISIVAGIGLSYIMKSRAESTYTSDAVFRNNLSLMDKRTLRDNSGTTSEIIAKINKLHVFCSESNKTDLAKAMSSDPESVKNISDISAFWIIDLSKDHIPDFVDYKGTYDVTDTFNIRMQDRYDVMVKIKADQDLGVVRDGIIKYIENDTLYQKRNNLRIRQNHDLLARLNFDILQLDSLQKVKYFEETRNIKPVSGGQIVFLQEPKTQLVYTDIQTLFTKKQQLESEVDLYSGIVTVLSDFSKPTERVNGMMYYGKNVIPYFFFITLLVLIIIANRKKLSDLYKKY